MVAAKLKGLSVYFLKVIETKVHAISNKTPIVSWVTCWDLPLLACIEQATILVLYLLICQYVSKKKL